MWKYAAPITASTTITIRMMTRAPVTTASIYMARVDVSALDCTDSAMFDDVHEVAVSTDDAETTGVAERGCEMLGLQQTCNEKIKWNVHEHYGLFLASLSSV